MMDTCNFCGSKDSDLRMGCCFDCATSGEERAARRSVRQHLAKAFTNARKGFWDNARIDLRWAFERLTRTGDYAPDGYFDHQVPDWRKPA